MIPTLPVLILAGLSAVPVTPVTREMVLNVLVSFKV